LTRKDERLAGERVALGFIQPPSRTRSLETNRTRQPEKRKERAMDMIKLVHDLAGIPRKKKFEDCCFIGCGKPAEFQILTMRGKEAEPDPYTNDTYSCEEHTGTLIGYDPDTEKPEELHWEIWPYPERDGR